MEMKEITTEELEEMLGVTEETSSTNNETFFFDKGILFLEEIGENTKNLISDIHFLNLKNEELH